MGFMDGLGYLVGGAVQGYDEGLSMQEKRQKLMDEQDARQGQALTGQILQGLGGVQPQAQQPSGIIDQVKQMFSGGQQPQAVPPAYGQGAPVPQGYAPPPPAMPAAYGGGGAPVQGPPMPQRMMPAAAPQAAPQGAPGGGMPQQPQGRLDWRQIVQMAKKANPNASPQAVALAVSNFIPLMSAQAQDEWKQVQMAILKENADTRAGQEKDQAFWRRERLKEDADKNKQDAADKAAALAEKTQADADKAEQKKADLRAKEYDDVSKAFTRLSNSMRQNPGVMNTPANQALLKKLQDKMLKLAGEDEAANADTRPPPGFPPDAKQADDGNWYVPNPQQPDPDKPNAWLLVIPHTAPKTGGAALLPPGMAP